MQDFKVPEDRPWFRFWPEGVPRQLDVPDIPLFRLLADAAAKWPESQAFSLGDRALSYAELDESSSRLAVGLAGLGVEKGDRVLLVLGNGLEFVISYYGVIKTGAAVVPINPLSRQAELRHHLTDTAATVVITDSAHFGLISEARSGTPLRTVILTDTAGEDGTVSLERLLKDNPPSPPEVKIGPSSGTAAIVYTGGTTGLSKGVLLSHRNLVANAVQNAVWFKWGRDDTVLAVLPFYHSWGASACMNSPVYSGARVIILPRFDAAALLSTIQEERVTVLYGAASMFTSLVAAPELQNYDISSLKYVKAGAMPIPPEIREKWRQFTGVEMVLGYGLSEASPETHNSPPDRVKPGTIGVPVVGTDARIVDEATGLREMPAGESGELVVRGPQVMSGYLNRPEDTAEALRDGWLYTGDLAAMDEEGYFHIRDRKKETIKYKGYTIAPAEVEAVLYEHPSVRECAVVGKPDDLCGEIPKAFIVLHQGHATDEKAFIDFCASRISPYKRIRAVEFIDEIPKTPVGKVLRRVLRDREREKGG